MSKAESVADGIVEDLVTDAIKITKEKGEPNKWDIKDKAKDVTIKLPLPTPSISKRHNKMSLEKGVI